MFDRIPHELRNYAQWVVWKYEEAVGKDKPKKVPYCPHTGQHAKVNDPSTWGTYDVAVTAASSGWFSGLGFVLTANDPYGFIDLDDTYDDQEAAARQLRIYDEFFSYAERSPSGKGLHIIVKGSLPSGRKRSFVEVYSSGRFMTMTGDVWRAEPINDHNDLLNALWLQIGKKAETVGYDGNVAQSEEDDVILQRACNAANGVKFQSLLAGQWQQLHPSQSEADLAFVNIVAFYTQNREQITRIFKNSALGQRDKQTTIRGVGYVDYMINKSFDRMLPPVDIDFLRIQIEEAVQRAQMQEQQQAQPAPQHIEYNPAQIQNTPVYHAPNNPEPDNPVYSVPPGLIGDIARFIFESAPRPVPEIALAGAIGLMAGICGRAYNISGTGLNQYVLLLAPTGTGKEAIASGIDKLIGAVTRTVPAAVDFIGPAEIASPQALTKYMAKQSKSFVSMVGEFGLMLQQMSAFNASPNMIGLRRILLDLYNKSGEGKILRPTIYSDREKNTEPVLAPAFSMLGESTPEAFYKALNEGMISEGLLPRFTAIEYRGKRPDLNENHTQAKPTEALVHQMATLCAHAAMLNNSHKTVAVQQDEEAAALFKQYDKHCDRMINGTDQEVIRHLWNRAHIKALKLSALLAVGVNPYNPLITYDVAVWATNLIAADVNNLLGRFEKGEVGVETAESKQVEEVVKAFRDYVMKDYADIAKHKIDPKMHRERVIPHRYLVQRLANYAAFRNDKIGGTNALKRAIETLKTQGDIIQMLPTEVAKRYEFSGVCYGISNVAAFGFE